MDRSIALKGMPTPLVEKKDEVSITLTLAYQTERGTKENVSWTKKMA